MSNKQKRDIKKMPERKQTDINELLVVKSKLWDIKDAYPRVKTFAATLMQFCAYTVLASAGIFIRISDTGVNSAKFWMLVAFGAILSTLPVFMYRYKPVLFVSLLLAITLGISTGIYAKSSKGVEINAFYYVDLFAIAMMFIMGFVLFRKLAKTSVKRSSQ
ncbi:MAG: hypothetical protein K8S87_09055 [Planctomycetes bacterium]|nr:hypothetical protein [Planctomycetota bacterium]